MSFTAEWSCWWSGPQLQFPPISEASSWGLLPWHAQWLDMWQKEISEDISGSAHCSALGAARISFKRWTGYKKELARTSRPFCWLPYTFTPFCRDTGLWSADRSAEILCPTSFIHSTEKPENKESKNGCHRKLCPNPIKLSCAGWGEARDDMSEPEKCPWEALNSNSLVPQLLVPLWDESECHSEIGIPKDWEKSVGFY